MTRTTHYAVKPAFVVDPGSIDRNSGRQVDWDAVPESYRQGSTSITATSTGGADIGATAVSVDSIPKDLPSGTLLNFGTYAAVTVTGKAADAGATTLPVVALAGPLPKGISLEFSTLVAKLAAAAASGATNVQVVALATTAITGETAEFPGGERVAVLSAAVTAAAATTGGYSIPVEPLALPIEAADVATINGTGAKTLPAGKVIVELTSGKIAPRSDRPGSEISAGFLETNAIEDDISAAKSGYGVIIGGALYENLLPDAVTYGATDGTLPAAYKTEMAATTNYSVKRFSYEKYSDNRS